MNKQEGVDLLSEKIINVLYDKLSMWVDNDDKMYDTAEAIAEMFWKEIENGLLDDNY